MKPRPDATRPAWVIEAYETKGDALVAERELPLLDAGAVRRLWRLAPDDPIEGALHVTERELPTLERVVGQRLDLARFAYFVSCVSDNGGVVRDQGPLYYTGPRTLPAFPEARRVRPRIPVGHDER
jgi:hypothetical protein